MMIWSAVGVVSATFCKFLHDDQPITLDVC